MPAVSHAPGAAAGAAAETRSAAAAAVAVVHTHITGHSRVTSAKNDNSVIIYLTMTICCSKHDFSFLLDTKWDV